MNIKNQNEWPSKEKLTKALQKALAKIDENLIKLEGAFPTRCAENLVYDVEGNRSWTNGFWPGIIWLAYELTGDKKYSDAAMSYIDNFLERIEKKLFVNHHDMGFLYSLSCIPAVMHYNDERAKKACILAADHLSKRFMEKGQFLNAWSRIEDIRPENNFYIVDCLINTPFLYRVSEMTGDDKYKKIADAHVATTVKTIMRADNSTNHSVLFDLETGDVIGGRTQQGFSDDSTWSRGQSWAVLGFPLNYRYSKNPDNIVSFERATRYFVDHLPKDYVPFWDFIYTDGDDQARDSSAAAIAVCGILEMSKYRDGELMDEYLSYGAKMMHSLIDNYAPLDDVKTDGLLLRGTGAATINMGVDVPNIWGDYYYLEAITRLLKPDWKIYW